MTADNKHEFQAGFVNIFGPPNAGKSTLLNALLGESLAITSPKVQTTRHRILGILTEDNYQIVFSDTPGILLPKYKLHEKMMRQIQSAIDDTDVALLMADVQDDPKEFAELLSTIRIKGKKILLLNKIDTLRTDQNIEEIKESFSNQLKTDEILTLSALHGINVQEIIKVILKYLPIAHPFYNDEDISDRPVRFFVSELIREQIYDIYEQEIPYHTAVLIQSFEEKNTLTKIRADIIVTRETQKGILLGKKGMMIQKLGKQARQKIEIFLGRKVFLELFVKVRPKWRDNELYLKEYGY